MMAGQQRIHLLYGDLVIRQLTGRLKLGASLIDRINRSATGLLDSDLIISDSRQSFTSLPAAAVRRPYDLSATHGQIANVLNAVEAEGIFPHFAHLLSLLGALLMEQNATPEQRALVGTWQGAGLRGAYLMTDTGGGPLEDWRSHAAVDGDRHVLSIDKRWAMFGCEMGFATVMVRKPGSLTPVSYLLGPDHCAGLHREAQGTPFVNASVQLARVTGRTSTSQADVMSEAGPLGVARYLSQARVRFVSAAMQHVRWLEAAGRISGGQAELRDLEHLYAIAADIINENVFTRYSIDEVLALKFAFNETILSLVKCGSVLQLDDARDLLGFSKMEGSSYHCFSEIYARAKASRDV
jgi:hypothetical protein